MLQLNEQIIKLKHMLCITCNCSIIAELSQLNKDDLESNIIMNRLIHLRYIKIQINGNGVYIFCQIRIYFSWLISLGPHTIVTAYNPESTIPGASYGQCHTCFQMKLYSVYFSVGWLSESIFAELGFIFEVKVGSSLKTVQFWSKIGHTHLWLKAFHGP